MPRRQRRDTWPQKEQEARDVLYSEARDRCDSTEASIDYLLPKLHEAAEQNQKFAIWILAGANRSGVGADFAAWIKNEKAMRVRLISGEVVEKSAVGGIKHQNSEGKVVHQLKFFVDMTLEELKEVYGARVITRDGVDADVARITLLTQLCQKANEERGLTPDSPEWNEMTPKNAADILGTTVDEWLLAGGEF